MRKFKNCKERIEFLRRNPIFWSRFGHEVEKGNPEAHIRNAQRHKEFYDKGIVVHSSVIPVGWIGPDQYDYSELDQLMELLFSTAPEILFLPRVKLNVPQGWCEAHPEGVFVYAGGPRTRDGIADIIGTPAHGSHPPKSTDLLAQQSFSSPQWIRDASEAFRRFLIHMERSPWADKIIGYHVAYGTSGETTRWGTWDKNPRHKGDYGIHETEAFLAYAKKRGKDYDDIPPIEERFFLGDTPVPDNRYHVGMPTLDQLFYHTENDERCVIYSEFTRDSNMDALETFCRIVKEIAPEKVAGVFYGYVSEPENCANMQHTGFDRMLASPWIDFVAGPKGYNRVGPTDPGFGQAIPNSVNRKKLWVDEIDNRTHLSNKHGHKDYPAKNFAQTRAVYWREFTKNVAFHQGYWWMDLGGGWLDSDEIRNEIALLNETSRELYLEADRQKGVAEVLLIIDENVMHWMRPNFNHHYATVGYTGALIKESGVPIDFYRMADLEELDLSRYKMIVFLNAFREDREGLCRILEKTRKGCRILWNYTAGILEKSDDSFDLENTRKLTGFTVNEYPIGHRPDRCYPQLYLTEEEGIRVLLRDEDGKACTAEKTDVTGRVHILNAMPEEMTVETMRELLTDAGVHLYAPAYCTVHADNRFLYVLSEKENRITVTLPEPKTCRNVFTGEIFSQTDRITADMEEGTCLFLKYLPEDC